MKKNSYYITPRILSDIALFFFSARVQQASLMKFALSTKISPNPALSNRMHCHSMS